MDYFNGARSADKAPNRRSRSSNTDVHLLTGLVYDETGDGLSPTHAYNHGKRYRYYVSRRLRYDPKAKEGSWRIAADELEGIVLQQAKEILLDGSMIIGWLKDRAVPADRLQGAMNTAALMAATLAESSLPEPRKQILQMMFGKITLSQGMLRFDVRNQTLIHHLLSSANANTADAHLATVTVAEPDEGADEPLVIERPVSIKRRGLETRLVITGEERGPESSLVELIARAHYYLRRLTDGSVSSIAELSREIGVYRSDISRVLPLAFLLPKITDAILTGSQPADLTARHLSRLIDMPHLWEAQASTIGM